MTRRFLVPALMGLLMLAAGCGGGSPTTASTPKSTGFAMIMTGPISDADYNALGYSALQDVGKAYGLKTAYSDNVAVADAASVARQYINSGFDIIAFHAGELISVATQLAPLFPKVRFIVEGSGPLNQAPPNVWNIARSYYPAFYLMGTLAARTTKTGTVAFLGAITFPDSIKGANSFFAGARSVNSNVKLLYAFTGDFVDPIKGRQGAEGLLQQGADVIVCFLNQAIQGVGQATEASTQPAFFTALYTDKLSLGPKTFLMSALFDFSTIYKDVIKKILNGQNTGNEPMELGHGIVIPADVIHNVPVDVKTQTLQAYNDILQGKVTVPTPIADKVTVPG